MDMVMGIIRKPSSQNLSHKNSQVDSQFITNLDSTFSLIQFSINSLQKKNKEKCSIRQKTGIL